MEPDPTNRKPPVSTAKQIPPGQSAAKDPGQATTTASTNESPKRKTVEVPANNLGPFAAEAKRPSSQAQSNEKKEQEQPRKRSTPINSPGLQIARQPILADVEKDSLVCASKADDAEVLQELRQLKATNGTEASRHYRPPTPTLGASTPPEDEQGTAVHCPQNSPMALLRPSQHVEGKPTAKESMEGDGRAFAHKALERVDYKAKPPEYINVPAVVSQREPSTRKSDHCEAAPGLNLQGADLQAPPVREETKAEILPQTQASPSNKPEDFVGSLAVSGGVPGLSRQPKKPIIASRASLPAQPDSQQSGSKSSLSRRVFFPEKIAKLVTLTPRWTSILNADEGGTHLGRGPDLPVPEDLVMTADRRRFEGRSPERFDLFRRASISVAPVPDAGLYKEGASSMINFDSPSRLDEAPRRGAASFMDGEQSVALKRAACLCAGVGALTTGLFLVTFLTGYTELRQPITLAPVMTEPDYNDVNRSEALIQPSFEQDEWITLTQADYSGVGTFHMDGHESAVTDYPQESEVISEG
ncbi:hypothetical protein V5799_008771 [Amblyomma americanum]|uniref:Uncharacterized protein n=1 Tax=Amblyomma americanum TaxID=6943 RepID=A0AAQ4FDR6_AMBAM